jgi:aminoglycoside phosphotransferase (APT) family kinase protein
MTVNVAGSTLVAPAAWGRAVACAGNATLPCGDVFEGGCMTMEREIDPLAVLAALGIAAADSIAPVGGGRDTALYRVEAGGAVYALRVFRPDQLAQSRNELTALEVADAGGIPVPRVLARGRWHDRPALLLAWCEGITVYEALLAQPERAEALGAASGRMLAAVHAVHAPEEYRDLAWLDWPRLGDTPLRARLAAVARHDRLLHLDFHPLNLLTHGADGARITAVLDWANARAGDPRADLARTLSILRLDADELPHEALPVVGAYEAGLLRGYGAAAGEPADLPLFLSWAGHVMLRDLAPRLAGNPAKRARIAAWAAQWERRAGIRPTE